MRVTLDVNSAEGREFNPRLEHYFALVTQWLECRSYEHPTFCLKQLETRNKFHLHVSEFDLA